MGDKLTLVHPKQAFNQTVTASRELVAQSKEFPSKLYATDIELLLRAPYNFYAKKILKLRKIQEISDTASLADFGNIAHQIFDKFVKMRNSSKQFDSNLLIKEIIIQEIELIHLPEQIKYLWAVKLEKIAIEFVEFDYSRRQDALVFSEVEGSIKLNIGANIITIAAIADRIEIDSQNRITILDYKTGTVPSAKEVALGLSPQLVIEAIIAYEGGFNLPTNYDLSEIMITFVKIGSSSPYLQITEIKLSAEDIMRHKQAMHKLIEHYVENKTYAIRPSIAKYDDYWLLARRDIEVGEGV
jgi:ATP-dependent helicase/nuclease subunit B